MENESVCVLKDSSEQTNSPDNAPLAAYKSSTPLAIFRSGMKHELNKANACANGIAKYVRQNTPELAQISEAAGTSYELVVDVSDDVKEKIAAGAIKLTRDKEGNTYAQMLGEKGRFGKKLPVKMEEVAGKADAVQLANAMQMKALEQQLENIAEQISVIDSRVKEVLQGQQNDRIALFESGMSLYLEAREIEDPRLRSMLIAQAQRALSDSAAQLNLEMRSAIRYLESGEYKSAKRKQVECIDEKMQAINRCFPVVHQAAIAKAAIYCEQGELHAMTASLQAYSHLIEETVGKNAGLLASFDKTDDGTEAGIWKSRAALQLDVTDLAKALNSTEKDIYLLPNQETGEQNEAC